MAKHRVMTEAQMLALVKKRAGDCRKGVRITKDVWAGTRRAATNKTGWNMARFEAWAARQVAAGEFTVAATTTTVSTPLQREVAMLLGEGGPKAEMGRAIRSVREAVARCTTNGHVSAALMTTMGENLKRRTQREVEAALLILAAQKEVTVEAKVRGVGGSRRDWANETMQWAVTQGWLGPQEANDLMSSAAEAIRVPTGIMPTVIELGSGWNGATEGLQRVFERVVTLDRDQHSQGQHKTTPDILADFRQGRDKKGGLVKWAARQSRTTEREQAAVWPSPSCIEESTCQGFNKGNTKK